MGKTLYEVFQGLHDMVQKEVDENDKKGFADLYKTAAELFFKQHKVVGFHPTNIEYLSGYFIFGFGTNSVVHYSLEECPGWRFGLWFGEPDLERNCVPAEWFAQYEATIDKFKPSASTFGESIYLYGDEGGYERSLDWRIEAQINFIHNEPDLAFCRDYCGWDYNTEYHTREEAHTRFLQWQNREIMEARGEQEYLRKTAEVFIKHIPEKFIDTCVIVDRGEHISPRYEFGYYDPNFNFEDEENPDRVSALYDWSDVFTEVFGLTQEDLDEMEQEFDAIDEWRRDYSDKNYCYVLGDADYSSWIVTTLPWVKSPTLKQFLSAE